MAFLRESADLSVAVKHLMDFGGLAQSRLLHRRAVPGAVLAME
jgi:hypothetical protein